jgi:hypothetical protein
MLIPLPYSSLFVFDRLCYRLGFNFTRLASRIDQQPILVLRSSGWTWIDKPCCWDNPTSINRRLDLNYTAQTICTNLLYTRPNVTMTMTLDTAHQQRFGPQMGFDYSAASQPPAFSNPWSSSSPPQPHGTGSSALMMGSHHQQLPAPQQSHHSHHPQSSALSANLLAAKAQPQAPRPTTTAAPSSMTPYGSLPVPTSTGMRYPSYFLQLRANTDSLNVDLLNLNRMQTSSAAYPDTTYASSASPVGGQFAPSSAPGYDALGYAPAPVRSAGYSMDADPTRRFSHS